MNRVIVSASFKFCRDSTILSVSKLTLSYEGLCNVRAIMQAFFSGGEMQTIMSNDRLIENEKLI